MLGLGLGMIISALTTKYRDLQVLVSFGVQLLMYISAVPYPLSVAQEKLPGMVGKLVTYNPLSQIIEGFRYMILDSGSFSWVGFGSTVAISMIVFLLGLIIFNRTEKNFIDTV